MSRIAYVNGRYVPHRLGRVHVEDRGFQFADAVYEVIAIQRGAFIDEDRHLASADTRSRGVLALAAPISDAALKQVMRETVRRNRVTDGIVYLQVSRGVAPRDFAFPTLPGRALVVTARRMRIADPRLIAERRRGHHRAGHALEAARHQIRLAAAQRAGKAAGERSRRLRGLAD